MPNVIETTDAAAGVGTTYTLQVGQTARGSLSNADSDWYRVDLVAGQQYTVAMVREGAMTTGVNDTYLNIRDTNGNSITFNDDNSPGAPETGSTVTFTATASGTYYIDARGYSSTDIGQYGVSITTGDRAYYDELMAAGVILRPGGSWSNSPGTAATVSWAVATDHPDQATAQGNSTAFIAPSAAQIATFAECLAQFSSVANISFNQVNPGGTSNNATVLLTAYNSTTDGAGAYAYYPNGAATTNRQSGDVSLNNDSVSTTSIPQGTYSYFAILHELGHAMGLAHPGDYNAGPGVDITCENSAQFIQDSQQYTIMSYFDESATTTSFESYADTLLLFDILALHQLYGANMTTRAGNTIYGFGSNAGSTYDFTQNLDPVFCIWDGGGTDTIDASGFSQSQLINLNAGQFSNIGGLSGNISIAFGAVIENAIGGSGNDTLIGSSANNTLNGAAGNDEINGGIGNDTVYGGIGNDTLYGAIGNDTLSGGSGNDFLYGGSGNDMLIGASGADTLDGGSGNDTYDLGSDTSDTISDYVGVDTIISAITRSLESFTFIENLTLSDTNNINGTGNAGENVLNGNAGNNTLNGLGGNDTLNGGAGNDLLQGGAGNDILSGGSGNDTLVGGSGNDRFIGASGNDTITLSSGIDTIVFSAPLNAATNVDTIRDFNVLEDRIELSHSVFAALSLGALAGSAFQANTIGLAQDASDRIVYESDTGNLYYDADGISGSPGTLFAHLSTGLSLNASHFLVV